MVAEDQAREAVLEDMKQAVKRKLEEREEWIKVKRLRVSIELAYEAMNVVTPLVEGGVAARDGGVAGGATGGDQVPAAEVIAAMENFEEAASNARKCLEDLTIHQQRHGAFQPSTLRRLMDEN